MNLAQLIASIIKPRPEPMPETVADEFHSWIKERVKDGTLTVADIDQAQDICLSAADLAFRGEQPAGDLAAESLLDIPDDLEGEDRVQFIARNVAYRLSGDAFYAGLIRNRVVEIPPGNVTNDDKARAFLEGAQLLADVLPQLTVREAN